MRAGFGVSPQGGPGAPSVHLFLTQGVVEPHPLMEQEEAVSPPEEPTPEDLSPVSDDYEVYSDRKRKRQSRGGM